jgi:hypothetical protein
MLMSAQGSVGEVGQCQCGCIVSILSVQFQIEVKFFKKIGEYTRLPKVSFVLNFERNY